MTNTEGSWPCDHRGRDGSYAAARQGAPRIACNHGHLGDSMEQVFPLSPKEETYPADSLICGLTAS